MRALWLSRRLEILKTKGIFIYSSSCFLEIHKDHTTMRLTELFEEIKEENLTKDQLESYRDEMAQLYSMMHLELGQVKKRKAIYLARYPEESTAGVERRWNGTEDGLREIELKSYIRATSPLLASLKDRLYQQY
jgi:hypothetical protein